MERAHESIVVNLMQLGAPKARCCGIACFKLEKASNLITIPFGSLLMFSARFWWQWCWWWCGPTISLLSSPDSNSWTCLLESQMLRKYCFLSKSLHSRTWPDTLQSPPLRKAAGYACATVDESHCPGQRVMNFLEPAGFLQHAWI